MLYLEAEQLEALRQRARAERIPMAKLFRRIVGDYLSANRQPAAPADVYRRIVAVGESCHSDVADHHDRYLAEALAQRHGSGEPQ
jgi:hypothetical protein